MLGGAYFNAFLDTLSAVTGPVVKSLDHEGMGGSALYDFIAKHSYVVGYIFHS